jgi:hypothetical protein
MGREFVRKESAMGRFLAVYAIFSEISGILFIVIRVIPANSGKKIEPSARFIRTLN